VSLLQFSACTLLLLSVAAVAQAQSFESLIDDEAAAGPHEATRRQHLDLAVPLPLLTPPAAPMASMAFAQATGGQQRSAERNAVLGLYGAFVALQVMDLHSSLLAMNEGGREGNPVIRSVARNPVALSAAKLAGTVATLYLAEQIWKRKPAVAIATMVGVNSAYVVVVVHNYRTRR
jgi:hypothetical protein